MFNIATSIRQEECDRSCFEQRSKSNRHCFRKSFHNDFWQAKAFFKTNKHYLAKQISKKCVSHGRLSDTLQSKLKANGYFLKNGYVIFGSNI